MTGGKSLEKISYTFVRNNNKKNRKIKKNLKEILKIPKIQQKSKESEMNHKRPIQGREQNLSAYTRGSRVGGAESFWEERNDGANTFSGEENDSAHFLGKNWRG